MRGVLATGMTLTVGVGPVVEMILLRADELALFTTGISRKDLPSKDIMKRRRKGVGCGPRHGMTAAVLLPAVESVAKSEADLSETKLGKKVQRRSNYLRMKQEVDDSEMKAYIAVTYRLAEILLSGTFTGNHRRLARHLKYVDKLVVEYPLTDSRRPVNKNETLTTYLIRTEGYGPTLKVIRAGKFARAEDVARAASLTRYVPDCLREFDLLLFLADAWNCAEFVEPIRASRHQFASEYTTEQLADYAYMRTLDPMPLDSKCPFYRKGLDQLRRNHTGAYEALRRFCLVFRYCRQASQSPSTDAAAC